MVDDYRAQRASELRMLDWRNDPNGTTVIVFKTWLKHFRYEQAPA